VPRPLLRPSDADLDDIAAILNKSDAITIYAGAGCEGAHDEVVATAARLLAPMAHTSRGKDFIEYDNPYNVGMTGIIGEAAKAVVGMGGLQRPSGAAGQRPRRLGNGSGKSPLTTEATRARPK
jgi:thiamine pyrophosphate-dependent acetolactate synthase large subunit-like protein